MNFTNTPLLEALAQPISSCKLRFQKAKIISVRFSVSYKNPTLLNKPILAQASTNKKKEIENLSKERIQIYRKLLHL